jgi:hypothetical protein
MTNIDKRLDKIEKILLRNTISLEDHMRRTALLEEEVKALRKADTARTSMATFIDSAFKIIASGVAIFVGFKNLFKS